jgi:hypothetical protein
VNCWADLRSPALLNGERASLLLPSISAALARPASHYLFLRGYTSGL